MEWRKPEFFENGEQIKIPNGWLHIHYYEALSTLFRIENSLRTFVFFVLKTELGDSWTDLEIATDDGNRTTIGALAKRRISQNETFGYLGYNINSPLMHLTSGELIGLITAETYWPYFSQYFRAAKHVIILKLQEIGNIRNSLAHFRPIKPDDVEVVKQNANQVLADVEISLVEAINCTERLPTNTEEEWYKELCTIGTQECTFRFHSSRDNRWIRIILMFRCLPLKGAGERPTKFVRLGTFTLDTPESITKNDNIRRHVTLLTECVPFPGWNIKPEMKFGKDLQFTFGRNVIMKNFKQIKSGFELLLSTISQECELIKDDNLARGDLVRLVIIEARQKETERQVIYWSFDRSKLFSPVKPNDPVEYWGDFSISGNDLITDVGKFPWMPVDISSFDVPF